MKVKILIPYYSMKDGNTVLYKPGMIAEISDNVVDKFVRSGFAEYISDKPAVKVITNHKAEMAVK